MKTRKSGNLVLTLMVCLTVIQYTVYARDEDLISMDMASKISVPFIESAPEIDGNFDVAEWKFASACTGFYDYKDIPGIMDNGPIVFMCYDNTSIYLLTLCPEEEGRALKAKCTNRDDNVYTDDSVEVYFYTPKKHLFQFVINPLGTLADLRDGDVQWNGNIQARASHILGEQLPEEYGLAGRYWTAEIEIPLGELDVTSIKPGDKWAMNIGVSRTGPWASLAMLSGSAYAEPNAFVPIMFLAKGEPFVQFTSLGKAQYGKVHICGKAVNPGAKPVDLKVAFDLWKHGSYLTEDAYQDIVGVIIPTTKKLALEPKSEVLLDIEKTVTNTAIDRMALRVFQVADGKKALLERPGFVKIQPQLNVTIGNVPPKEYLVLKIDPIGLKNELKSPMATMDIIVEAVDKNGKVVLTRRISDALKNDELVFDYKGLPDGEYICRITPVIEDGKKIQSYQGSFRHPAKPDWWNDEYDRYAKADRVLKPWTSIEYGENSISVWGRTMKWEKGILPSSITTQGKELLVKPMRLVAVFGGKEHFIGLDNFKFTSKKQSRAEMVAEGFADGLKVRAQMWFEYDGFGWITLNLSDSKKRKIEKLWVEVPMESKYITLYQGFARDAFGFVKNEPIQLKWQYRPDTLELNFYHWCGNEDLGLGFTYRTLEHWYPKSIDNFCTLIPGEKETIYKMNLIGQAVEVNGFKYEFGIQATPIKPLPPDWHVMLATSFYNSFMNVPHRAQEKIPEKIDILVNWQTNVDMKGLNDPLGINSDKMNEIIRYAHGKGMAVSGPATCPQKISPVMKDYDDYKMAWKNIPESLLNWDKIPHLQNCGGSEAYRRWLFSTWAKFIKTYDIDCIYFDGWPAGQMGCYSPHQDNCGWADSDGKRHLTVAILEGREFLKALALYMEDNIKSEYIPPPKTGAKREGFPRYHLWIHSWNWVPPAVGFATIWFTGEFAAYPFKPNVAGMKTAEGSMAEAVGMDLFRTRCLSTNWGVPNLYDTISVTYRQTEMMMAWLLPHGSQVGAIDFMSGGPQLVSTIYNVFEKFGARTANFTPCWRDNPYVDILNPRRPDVVAATWDHSADKVLAVVSNLRTINGGETTHVTLKLKGFTNPKVTNALTQEQIPVKDNIITLDIEPEMFVLMLIEM
ncbi:MAG: glycoside hydrolase domain-containing protein [Planctomycetota bacterium]